MDHVAVAVEHWPDGWSRYLGDLGAQWLAAGRGPGFAPSQMRLPPMKVEVLEPNDVEVNDFLRRFLDANGPGPHHLTFKVPDLAAGLDVIRDHGYDPIGVFLDDPGWKESFVHPKQACGIVVQIAQAAGDMPDELQPPPVPSRVERPASLVEVVHLVPDLAPARALFVGLLGGEVLSSGDADLLVGWPGGSRVRLVRPAGGSAAEAWLGSRPGRLGHLLLEVDDPAAVPDAVAAGDGSWEVPPEANFGTRLVLRARS
jgi:methylmalonyl-CoA/ethylmalonyl-CoA epimerase